jgi:thioredoxin-related protein
MKKTIILLGILFLTGSGFAQSIEFTDKSWEETLAEAKATNQNIFVDAYTTWCAPCKKMSKYVFTKPNVGGYYNENFISIKLDMEKGEGRVFANKYKVRAYPTLLYFAANGDLLHRVVGSQDAEKIIETGKKALSSVSNSGSLTKRYLEGERSPDFLRGFAYVSKAAADTEYSEIAEMYLNTQTEWSSSENMQFIFDFTENTRSRHFNYLIENRSMFEDKFGINDVFNKVQSIVQNRLDLITNEKSADTSKELIEADNLFQKVYKEESMVKFAAFRMTYFRTQGDRDGFAQAAVDYVENIKGITADELNSIARTFAEVIEDKVMLEKAVEWSKRAIEMENLYTNHYTLAALYYKLDKKGKAKRVAKKAIRVAKKADEDPAYVEILLNEMKRKTKS